MRYLRGLLVGFLVTLILLAAPGRALAFPPLPSSIWGTVKLNGANLSDGTLVEAVISDKVVAYSQTQTYEGNSVYSLNIPGDDPSSAAMEGGREGDTVYFRVGGIQAEQTGVWDSATSVRLDLTAVSASTPLPPQPTPTPLPTQTPITVAPTAVPPTRTPVPVLPIQATSSQVPLQRADTALPETQAQPVATRGPAESLSTQAAAATTAMQNMNTNDDNEGAPLVGAAGEGKFTSASPGTSGSMLIYWIVIPAAFLLAVFGLWAMRKGK